MAGQCLRPRSRLANDPGWALRIKTPAFSFEVQGLFLFMGPPSPFPLGSCSEEGAF
jgi:hypothetical protein